MYKLLATGSAIISILTFLIIGASIYYEFDKRIGTIESNIDEANLPQIIRMFQQSKLRETYMSDDVELNSSEIKELDKKIDKILITLLKNTDSVIDLLQKNQNN